MVLSKYNDPQYIVCPQLLSKIPQQLFHYRPPKEKRRETGRKLIPIKIQPPKGLVEYSSLFVSQRSSFS